MPTTRNLAALARPAACAAGVLALLLAGGCSREPDLATMLSTGEPVGDRPSTSPPSSSPDVGCPNGAADVVRPRPANT